MTTRTEENVNRPSVVVLGPLSKELLDRIQDRCNVTVAEDPNDRSAVELALRDAEGVLLTHRITVDDALLSGAKRLRVISNLGVGLDHIDLESAERRKIEVLTTPVLMDAVADLVMTFALMLTRRMPEAIDAVRAGRWRQVALGHDLRDKNLLVIGFGRIGQEVARRALSFKMKVLFYDLRGDLPKMDGAQRVPDVHSGLKVADFVSLHVDLNRSTRHLISTVEFEIMKPSAYLINTSRGSVVDQKALTKALAEGQIAGAGLDVLEDEPPSVDEPLLDEPKAIIVPHIGSATVETRNAMINMAVDNLITGVTRATSIT
jgi:glyoxylate reductase